MKKTLLLLATIAILLMSLTACGEDKKNDGGMEFKKMVIVVLNMVGPFIYMEKIGLISFFRD